MLARHLIMPLLVLIANGCSRTEFAYRNADWFLESHAKKTVAAYSEQIEQWRPVVQSELEYHRTELLPLLIAYLDLLGRVTRDSDSAKSADCLVDAGLYLYERHAQLAVDLAVPLLMMIDSSQVRHLTDYMARGQEKNRKLYLKTSLERQHKARLSRFIRRTEHWIGKLNNAQVEEMERAIRKIPDLSAHWLNYKEQQTAGLIRMLGQNPDEQAVRNYLSDWWISFAHRSVEYDQDWTIAKHEFSVLLHKLGASLTVRQRDKIKQTIATYRKDLASFQAPLQQSEKLPEILLCSSSA